ncbi:uncharacterized protein LOC127975148 [Carassius gibelio]|uniref:uncharacterized protein LOC127975148 n=1 Tax=Carassius gibelio TaxID=101364 RepID=UPI0022788845|nr:uncharacterized protein LOC127975148 [Carassius gibelio]
MQSPAATPLADIIASFAVLHRKQHQALLELRTDQKRLSRPLSRPSRRTARGSGAGSIGRFAPRPMGRPAEPMHLPLHKMGPQDDPGAFLELFEKSAEACSWPREQWPVRLIPLLSGEAQVAAQQLLVENLMVFDDLKRAVIQRVGRLTEQHRQRFRSLDLGEAGRPFAMAQQLRDSCRKWLLAEGSDVEHVVDLVVLEHFIALLPKKTAEWVQCHRPTSPSTWRRTTWWRAQGSAHPHLLTLSLLLSLPPLSLALSLSLGPVHPALLVSRPGSDQGHFASPRAPPFVAAGGDSASVSPLSPRQFSNPLPATGAAGRSGLACWRCGDPEHFVDRCPVMEVGTMIWVPDVPQVTPGQAGEYQIPTDASDRGLGAFLSQDIEGEERPVLYISRKLSKREANYSTIEKECLAIRWAILTLRYYLLGWEFTLCSDHAPLQWLHLMKDTNARITCWYLALQPFKFKVIHRPGVQMAVADFLSRNGLQSAAGERIRRRVVSEWFGQKLSSPVSCSSNWRGESIKRQERRKQPRERRTADASWKQKPERVKRK